MEKRTIHEEEVPTIKPLLEDGHLAETTASAAARKQDGAGCFRFDEDGAAHLDAAAELASGMAEEPILRYGESVRKLLADLLAITANVLRIYSQTYPGCVRNVSIKNLVFQREIAP